MTNENKSGPKTLNEIMKHIEKVNDKHVYFMMVDGDTRRKAQIQRDIWANRRYNLCYKLVQDDIDNQRIIHPQDVLDKFHICMK